MPKIKDIHERIHKNPAEYNDIRFLVARRMFITVVTLYFLSFLFTIGGYYLPWMSIETMSMLTFHLYSLLIVATVWFGFSIAEYMVVLYAPLHNWIPYAVLSVLFLFG